MYITPSAQPAAWPSFPGGGGGGGGAYRNNGTAGEPGAELPSNWSSLIGIVTAIIGNVLIALALNVQRYAHIQLERQRRERRERARRTLKGVNGRGGTDGTDGTNGTMDTTRGGREDGRGYGAMGSRSRSQSQSSRREDVAVMDADESRPLVDGFHNDNDDARPWTNGTDAEAGRTTAGSPDRSSSNSSSRSSSRSGGGGGSTSYLRSPSWWLGQVLITVGESGNFLAYGFAPASIVSPLGVVALISNCVIAPILFKERFRLRDFWGVLVAVGGAVTVVLSAKQEETKLAPHDVWDAITTTAFEIYLAVTCSLIALLMWASPRYGHRTILIDLGLVGLFGAYTVLATKGVSSMLSSTLLGAFLTPMTYSLIVILLGTAVMQVRYVNKALQRFDSTQVIPIQFVMFTLSVIVGSAVLYRDFERTTAEQAAKFVGGCLLTFSGVFVITSGRPSANSGDDDADDDDDDAAGDGGMESEALAAAGHPRSADSSRAQTPATSGPPAGSRRSSRASRVSFSGLYGRPFSLLPSDIGVPSSRVPPSAAVSRLSVPSTPDGEGGAEDALPLLANPWRSAFPDGVSEDASSPAAAAGDGEAPTSRPVLGAPANSADSVLHAIHSSGAPAWPSPTGSIAVSGAATISGTAMDGGIVPDRPVTPVTALRPYTSHFQSPMISPSPLLSSTVSTVVADTILKHMDGASPHHAARRLSNRRQRQGLRSSLFVPQDELDDAEWLMQPFLGQQSQHQHQHAHHHTHHQHHPSEISEEPTLAEDGPASASARDERGASRKESGRERTRSLSNTLGNLLWTRRKRRNTSPETDGGRAMGHSGSLGENTGGESTGGENTGGENTGGDVRVEQDYTANDDIPPAADP